jgi:hypothetical protein
MADDEDQEVPDVPTSKHYADAAESLERLRGIAGEGRTPMTSFEALQRVSGTSKWKEIQKQFERLGREREQLVTPAIDTSYLDDMARAKREQIEREQATVDLLGKIVDLHEQTDAKQAEMLALQRGQEEESHAQRRREIIVIWLTAVGLGVGILALIVTVIGLLVTVH